VRPRTDSFGMAHRVEEALPHPNHYPRANLKSVRRSNCSRSGPMNCFDLQYWEGARESALAIYEYVNERKDVPDDVRA